VVQRRSRGGRGATTFPSHPLCSAVSSSGPNWTQDEPPSCDRWVGNQLGSSGSASTTCLRNPLHQHPAGDEAGPLYGAVPTQKQGPRQRDGSAAVCNRLLLVTAPRIGVGMRAGR